MPGENGRRVVERPAARESARGRSSSNWRRWRRVTGLSHIKVFIAGARMTGLAKSQARKMQLRKLSEVPERKLRQRVGIEGRDDEEVGPLAEFDVQDFVAPVVPGSGPFVAIAKERPVGRDLGRLPVWPSRARRDRKSKGTARSPPPGPRARRRGAQRKSAGVRMAATEPVTPRMSRAMVGTRVVEDLSRFDELSPTLRHCRSTVSDSIVSLIAWVNLFQSLRRS